MKMRAITEDSSFFPEVPSALDLPDEAPPAGHSPTPEAAESLDEGAPFGGDEQTQSTRKIIRPPEQASSDSTNGISRGQPEDELSVSVTWDIDEALDQGTPRAGLFSKLRRLFRGNDR